MGNRLTKTQPDTKDTYTYDNIYRLLKSLPTKLTGKDKDQDNKSETFAYDKVGNRLTGPEAGSAYSYDTDNELTGDQKHSYRYDRNGNLIEKTGTDDDGKTKTWTYGYDYENRLVKVTKQEATETETVTFKYDPFGRRIEKKVEGADKGVAEAKTYVYDNEDIVSEYDSTGSLTARYTHGPGIDEPLAIERKGDVYYYHADGLGSIVALTDTNQKTVESYTYSAFGELKRKGDKVKNTFTYTGREWDEETGLYYYRARYYDAKVGRFISKDPIGFAGGDVNLYGYVGNNPVNWIDPYGLWMFSYNAGAHAPTGPWPVAVGGTVGSQLTSLDASGHLVATDPVAEAVAGVWGDIGVSVGIADISGTGNQSGTTIGIGAGRYGGVQITLRNEFDSNRAWYDPLRYIEGVSVGLGLGLSLPVNFTTPLQGCHN